MNKYRGAKLIRSGFIGVVLVILVIAVGLSVNQLGQRATSVRYQALFSEAGGLAVGNDVTVSGMKVGSVSKMALHNGDVLVTFVLKGTVLLGSETTAQIRTGSLLGQRVMTLESAGSGRLHPMGVIPVSHTSSPYSLNDALSDLTGNTEKTCLGTPGPAPKVSGWSQPQQCPHTVDESLDALSLTLRQIAPQLGPAFDGVTRLSQALNSRDKTLGELLRGAADVTKILSQRSDQVNTLILNADDLLQVLVARRQAIVQLLANTSAVAQQLTGLVHDNEAKLAPTLDKLNSVTAMLEKNRDNINKALPGLAKYQLTQGEAVASGYYYSAFIPNAFLPEVFLQPFFDFYFGFRRGSNGGRPPDNAGPRALVPFPSNGIPPCPGCTVGGRIGSQAP